MEGKGDTLAPAAAHSPSALPEAQGVGAPPVPTMLLFHSALPYLSSAEYLYSLPSQSPTKIALNSTPALGPWASTEHPPPHCPRAR